MIFQDGFEHKIEGIGSGGGDAIFELSQYDNNQDYDAIGDLWKKAYTRHAGSGVMGMLDGSIKTYSEAEVGEDGNWKFLYNYVTNPEWKGIEEEPDDLYN